MKKFLNSMQGLQLLYAVLLVSLLTACGGSPAPVAERSEVLERTRPIIVTSSSPSSVLQSQNSRPQVANSTPIVRNNSIPVTSLPRASGSSGATGTHQVRAGDTLFSIAYQHDLDFRALALANDLRPPYTIFVGQELSLNVNQPASGSAGRGTDLGTPVGDNQVARSQGTSGSGGLLRAPVGTTRNAEPEWQWPYSGRVLQGFAAGSSKGLDIGGRVGDSVQAAGAGDVVYAGRGIQGSGELIILRHNDRYLSAYAHNRAILVQEGDHVEAGQQIAELGENPTGVPMLHFEIRLDGKSIDPQGLLPRR